jgi:hypothetical protein
MRMLCTFVARWRLLVVIPAILVVTLAIVLTAKHQALFGDNDGGRLGDNGLDHDSEKALKAAMKAPKHVSFELHSDNPYHHKFAEHTCTVGRTRNALPEALQEPLNFTTTVHTNMKILFLGDFQTVLFSEAFQEATGVERKNQKVLLEFGYAREAGLHISTTDDYGVVAGYRTNNMLSRDGEGQLAAGWRREDVENLLNYTMPWGAELEKFDVLIFKPPQTNGTGSLDAVTEESLSATLELATELFGMSSVILMTLPLHQDYRTEEHLEKLQSVNDLIRSFGQNWEPKGQTVKNVLVLDFDRLAYDAVKENAASLGMDIEKNYLLERLKGGKSKPAVAHVCGAQPVTAQRHDTCKSNMIATDGVYWCMETIGGRVMAGLSCLLQCVTKPGKECCPKCNEQFMSLKAVDETIYKLEP